MDSRGFVKADLKSVSTWIWRQKWLWLVVSDRDNDDNFWKKMVRGTDLGEKMKCLFPVEISSGHWVWRSRGRSLLETILYLFNLWNTHHKVPLIITACLY